jgi:hypothetical protein
MRFYELFIDDPRYPEPSKVTLIAEDDDKARMLAKREMDASSHRRGAELRAGNVRIFGLGTMHEPRTADERAATATVGLQPTVVRRFRISS